MEEQRMEESGLGFLRTTARGGRSTDACQMEVTSLNPLQSVRALLASEAGRIDVHDEVGSQASRAVAALDSLFHSDEDEEGGNSFSRRLESIDALMTESVGIQALLAYWGTKSHAQTLTLPVRMIFGWCTSGPFAPRWADLRWYPALVLLYAGGVAAVASGRYENLGLLMLQRAEQPPLSDDTTLMSRVVSEISETASAFRQIRGKERHYIPMNEHLLELLKQSLTDLLWLGNEFDTAFDRFELLLSLEFASQRRRSESWRLWAPIGRFGYASRRWVLDRIVSEASRLGESWPPIRAGLFEGSTEHIDKLLQDYRAFVERVTVMW